MRQKIRVMLADDSVVMRRLLADTLSADPDIDVVHTAGHGKNAVEHLETLRGIPGVDLWRLASIQALHRFYQTRTGLVEALSQVVAQHDGNWLESRMARLGGQFAGILRVGVPDAQAVAMDSQGP